jgi:hypothetical protein
MDRQAGGHADRQAVVGCWSDGGEVVGQTGAGQLVRQGQRQLPDRRRVRWYERGRCGWSEGGRSQGSCQTGGELDGLKRDGVVDQTEGAGHVVRQCPGHMSDMRRGNCQKMGCGN